MNEPLKIIDDDHASLSETDLRVLKRMIAAWQFSRWLFWIIISAGGSMVAIAELAEKAKGIWK